ncbi:hypothetical protein AHF37_09955 [Paragonimus kellicotti]|nr:hypothetical protein AHF37_09955 [Paragonimus kellicotti]
MCDLLRSYGLPHEQLYLDELEREKDAFDQCPFVCAVSKATTREELDTSWTLIDKPGFKASRRRRRDHASYLHFLVEQYLASSSNPVLQRGLVRLMFKIALAGVDIQARDDLAQLRLEGTALVTQFPGPSLSDIESVDVKNENERAEQISHESNTQFEHISDPTSDALEDKTSSEQESMIVAEKGVDSSIGNLKNECVHREFYVPRDCFTLRPRNSRVLRVDPERSGCVAAMEALGDSARKVKSYFDRYYNGIDPTNLRAMFVARPLIVSVMDYSTTEAVELMLTHGADLTEFYSASQPPGPVAFWAFQETVPLRTTLKVVKTAPLDIRDAHGGTMLHRAVRIFHQLDKADHNGHLWASLILLVLLNRGVRVELRDCWARTARDVVVSRRRSISDQCMNLNGQSLRYRNVEHQAPDLYELRELIDPVTGHLLTPEAIIDRRVAQLAYWDYVDLMEDLIIHLLRSQIALRLADLCPQLAQGRDCFGRTPMHYAICIADNRRLFLKLTAKLGGVDKQTKDFVSTASVLYMAKQSVW